MHPVQCAPGAIIARVARLPRQSGYIDKTMPLNWIDTTQLPFNYLLLLERVQISWLPGWVPEYAFAITLWAIFEQPDDGAKRKYWKYH